jgi:hypothetical protein
MLAFKESQELPEFSTVGNDNRRTRSRLHGYLPPSVRDPLMRSAAHVRSYSVVIGRAAAISDVSGGQIGDLSSDHQRNSSEAQISVFLDHSAIKNNCNAEQQGDRCDRAMCADFRCWRGSASSARVSAEAIPEVETEINNGTHDHKPPL